MICCVYRRGAVYWGKLQLAHEAKLSRFSLGTSDKRVAQTELLRRAREREMEHAGLLAPSSVRESAGLSFESMLSDFLLYLQRDLKRPATLKKYRSNLLSIARSARWVSLRDMTAQSFYEWIAHCGLSGKSINDTLGALRVFAGWLKYERKIIENPFALVRPVDLRDSAGPYRRALAPAELQHFLASVPVSRRLVYVVAVRTGLRRKELRLLRWGDILWDVRKLRVRAASSKNRREAVLPLSPEVFELLRAARPQNAAPFTPVFSSIPNAKTVRRDYLAAGIPLVDDRGQRVDLHALRATFATDLMDAGASLHELKELMRHSDVRLTLKTYVDAGRLELSSVVSRLPPVCLPDKSPDSSISRLA